MSVSSNLNQNTQSRSASSQMLTSASQLSAVRDYERSDSIGMMHMNRSDISEPGVRKRGVNYSNSLGF